jgi:hypothetical protein
LSAWSTLWHSGGSNLGATKSVLAVLLKKYWLLSIINTVFLIFCASLGLNIAEGLVYNLNRGGISGHNCVRFLRQGFVPE